MAEGESTADPGLLRGLAHMGARIDRLPLTPAQWELAILTQIAWGLIVFASDGIAARLYPFIWAPKHQISSVEYSTLYAFEVGFGVLIGDYTMALISDHFGRRPAIAMSALFAGAFLWPFALVTNFWALLVLSIFSTFGVGAILSTHAVYTAEVTSPSVRSRVLLGSQGVTALVSVVVGLMAFYWVPSHYQLYLYVLTAALIVLAPILYLRMPESPRWLESHQRHYDAERELTKIENRVRRWVKQLPEPDPDAYPLLSTEKVPWHEVFTNVAYRARTILLLIAWVLGYGGIIYGFGAYIIVYMVDHGAGSHYVFLLTVVSGLFSFAAFQVMSRIGERVERRDTQLVSAVVFVISVFVIYWWPNKIIFDIFYIVSAIAIAQWLFNMYNYTAVAFPTRVRSVGVGIADGFGHIGAWGGSQIAGHVYTAGPNHLGWILLITIPGALVPALLVRWKGITQREAVLEQVST